MERIVASVPVRTRTYKEIRGMFLNREDMHIAYRTKNGLWAVLIRDDREWFFTYFENLLLNTFHDSSNRFFKAETDVFAIEKALSQRNAGRELYFFSSTKELLEAVGEDYE